MLHLKRSISDTQTWCLTWENRIFSHKDSIFLQFYCTMLSATHVIICLKGIVQYLPTRKVLFCPFPSRKAWRSSGCFEGAGLSGENEPLLILPPLDNRPSPSIVFVAMSTAKAELVVGKTQAGSTRGNRSPECHQQVPMKTWKAFDSIFACGGST